MTDHIDTREGWREIKLADIDWSSMEVLHRAVGLHEHYYWVREKPVPPLPTEPYTVIRVTWREVEQVGSVLLLDGDNWVWRDDEGQVAPRDLANVITGFEVLASAGEHGLSGEALAAYTRDRQYETAKAIYDEMDLAHWTTDTHTINSIFQKFGVDL